MTISTQVLVETPEGVDLQAEPAGVIVRMLAYLIDFAIRAAVFIALLLVLSYADRAGIGVFFVCWFLLEWFYPVVFEVCYHGQTPGKKMMRLCVVNDDLTPIRWGTSVIRNLLRVVDILPNYYLIGVIAMVCNRKFQRLGDIAAGTLVVYKKIEPKSASETASKPHASPVPLEREDQIAIISFAQRRQQLSEDRQRELADILEPVLPTEGSNRVDYLRGIGAWLLGER